MKPEEFQKTNESNATVGPDNFSAYRNGPECFSPSKLEPKNAFGDNQKILEFSGLKELQASNSDAQVPGVKREVANDFKVMQKDKNGNPTRLERNGTENTFDLKYDSQGRMTEMKSGEWKAAISYNDKTKQQTIKETGINDELVSTTVNTFDAKGKISKEEYKNLVGEKTVSHFDSEGHISSQLRTLSNGEQRGSSYKYEAGKISSSSTTRWDASGKKLSSEQTHFDAEGRNQSSTINNFDENGKIKTKVEVDYTKGNLPVLKESKFDKDGHATGVADIKYEQPYLVGEIAQKDNDGNLISQNKASWKVYGGMGVLQSVEVKSPDGAIKIIDSKGKSPEDRKAYREMQKAFGEYSNPRMFWDRSRISSPGASVLDFNPYSA